MGTGVADRAIGLDDVGVPAHVALGGRRQGLVLPVLDLPLNDIVATLAEVV